MDLNDYCSNLPIGFQANQAKPWLITGDLENIINGMLDSLGGDYATQDGVAIHKSAQVDPTIVIKAPAIIGPDCVTWPGVLLRPAVILGRGVNIGHGCEIKSSVIGSGSAVAHLNYVGNSIVGSNVNIEGGAVIANHFNEREDKRIFVIVAGERIDTGVQKFGAVIGDGTRIGANAVTTPGTILPKGSVVKRLELVEQDRR